MKTPLQHNPKLKENPFNVPQGYMAQMQTKLQAIATEHVPEKPKGKLLFLQTSWFKTIAAAATIALVITLVWPNKTEIIETVSADEIVMLTENGYLPYNEYYLLEVMDDDELDDLFVTDESTTDYYEYTQPEMAEDYYLLTEEI